MELRNSERLPGRDLGRGEARRTRLTRATHRATNWGPLKHHVFN